MQIEAKITKAKGSRNNKLNARETKPKMTPLAKIINNENLLR